MVVDTSGEKKRKKESERDIRKAIDKTKGKLAIAKEQMKNILKNVSETAIKAASALSIDKKTKQAKPLKSLDKASVISDKASINSDKVSNTSVGSSTGGLERGGESDFFRD
jgi:multidrug resistance efflux pump